MSSSSLNAATALAIRGYDSTHSQRFRMDAFMFMKGLLTLGVNHVTVLLLKDLTKRIFDGQRFPLLTNISAMCALFVIQSAKIIMDARQRFAKCRIICPEVVNYLVQMYLLPIHSLTRRRVRHRSRLWKVDWNSTTVLYFWKV